MHGSLWGDAGGRRIACEASEASSSVSSRAIRAASSPSSPPSWPPCAAACSSAHGADAPPAPSAIWRLSRAISACSARLEPVALSLTTARFRMSFARCAKLSVEIVSEQQRSRGDTLATMHVRALPPRLSLSSIVSLESR